MVYFAKNYNPLNTYFKKGGVGNTILRKAYHTIDNIGRGLNTASNIGQNISPAISSINLPIGTAIGQGGNIAGGIGGVLRNVANQAKMFKKSIER